METVKSQHKILSPFVSAFLSIFITAAGCSALTGYTLWKIRYRIKALVFFFIAVLLFFAQVAGIFYWDKPWRIVAPAFCLYNLVLGLIIPLIYLQDYKLDRKTGNISQETGGLKRLVGGIITGGA